MKHPDTKHWPLFAALAVFGLTMTVFLILSLRLTGGHLIYPLDDAYIQMAMAKNLVLHGTWGVTRYGFSGSSSSPLWTLLIAGTYLPFGVNAVAPFVLSFLSGTIAVAVAYAILDRHVTSRPVVFATCVLGIFLAPLPPVVFTGMEHALHSAISLGLVWLASRALGSTGRVAPRGIVLLALLSALLTAIRYEGFYLVFVICSLLLLNRRIVPAMAAAAAAVIPPLAYGLWSVSKGGLFLPNSVLVKGISPGTDARAILQTLSGYTAWANAGRSPHLLLLLIVACVLLVLKTRRRSAWGASAYAVAIFAGTALVHLTFAQPGWFYRYDAYLVMMGLTAIVIAAWELDPTWRPRPLASLRHAAATLFLVLFLSPVAIRAVRASYALPQATKNTYEQQYQMGLFLGRYYRGARVAANDIGAISYLADARLLDLMGLANPELALLKVQNRYTAEQAFALAKQWGVQVAIVYRDWFSCPEWTEVGQWRIRNNVACARDNVSICAVDSSAAAELARNLAAFAPALPSDIEQSGLYTRK